MAPATAARACRRTATIDGDIVRIRRPDGSAVVLRGHTGNRIITSGEDGTVRTYDCEICRSGPALAVAGRRLADDGRPLTPEERSHFVP
jgi:hypothetical protein